MQKNAAGPANLPFKRGNKICVPITFCECINSGRELAEQELQFASDRFKNGVANNIEVVNAQDALSRALDNRTNALAQHAEAKISLAASLVTNA